MASPLRVGGAALVGALALVAAGCGGSSSPSSSATTTAATTTTGSGTTRASGTQSTAFKAFQTCLAGAGIKTNFGGGRPGGGGTRPAGGKRPTGGGGFGGANLTTAQRKAFTACQSKLPSGSGRGGFTGRRNGGATNPALAKYTTCLKQHGVTLGASTKPATFKKASAACTKYAPSGATAQ
jgi:hypothetical protein